MFIMHQLRFALLVTVIGVMTTIEATRSRGFTYIGIFVRVSLYVEKVQSCYM